MAKKIFIAAAVLIFGNIIFNKLVHEPVSTVKVIKKKRPIRPVRQETPAETTPPEEKSSSTESTTSDQNHLATPASPVEQAPAVTAPEPFVQVAAPTNANQPTADVTSKTQMEQTEEMRKEIEELISDARRTITARCNCSISFEVDWASFQYPEALIKASYTVDNFKRAMPPYCADEGAPTACKIKHVRISFSLDPEIKWMAGTANLTTNGVVHKTFDDVIAIVEKE